MRRTEKIWWGMVLLVGIIVAGPVGLALGDRPVDGVIYWAFIDGDHIGEGLVSLAAGPPYRVPPRLNGLFTSGWITDSATDTGCQPPPTRAHFRGVWKLSNSCSG